MEMTSSINRFINFGKAIEFGKLELEDKSNSIKKSENNIHISFGFRVILFLLRLLLNINLIREYYELWYIYELEKSLLLARGYKELIKDIETEKLISELNILNRYIPFYEMLDFLFQEIPESKCSDNEKKIYFLFHELTKELKSIRASISILMNRMNKILNDIKSEELAKQLDEEMAIWDMATDEDIAKADLLFTK